MKENLYLYTDGAYNGKRGGIGIYEKTTNTSFSIVTSSKTTSNINEYFAFLLGAAYFVEKYPDFALLKICSDSRLVINQLSGVFAIRAKHLYYLNKEIKNKIKNKKVVFSWISRRFNQESDALAKSALNFNGHFNLAAINSSLNNDLFCNIFKNNLESLSKSIEILNSQKYIQKQ